MARHRRATAAALEYPIGKVLYDAAGWVSHVRVSPDGRLVAFVDHPQQGDNNGNVKVVDLGRQGAPDGPVRPAGPRLVPARRRGLVERRRDGILATSPLRQEPARLEFPGREPRGHRAATGACSAPSNSSRREIVGLSAGDKAERNLTWLNWSFPTDIAPTARPLLFNEQNIQPPGVYLRKLDGSPAVRHRRRGTRSLVSRRTVGALQPGPRERAVQRFCRPARESRRILPKTGINLQSGDLASRWRPDPRSPATSRGTAPASSSRTSRAASPAPSLRRESTSSFDASPGREVGRGHADRTAASPSTRSSPASRAPCRARARRRPAAVDAGRQADLRLPPVRAAPARRDRRREDGPADALEGAPASRSLRSRAGRPDRDLRETGSYVYSYRRALDDLYLATGLK